MNAAEVGRGCSPGGIRGASRSSRLLAVATASLAVILGLGATAAHAHGGAAVFDTDVDVAGLRVSFDVGITYETDGEPAQGAVVHADGSGPGGQETGAIRLERGDSGRYTGSADVPTPGRWRFTIESTFPPGTTVFDVEVPDAADRPQPGWLVPLVVVGGAILLLAAVAVRRRSRREPVGQ